MGSEDGSTRTYAIRRRILEHLGRLRRTYDRVEGTVRRYTPYAVRIVEVILAVALFALLAHWVYWVYIV